MGSQTSQILRLDTTDANRARAGPHRPLQLCVQGLDEGLPGPKAGSTKQVLTMILTGTYYLVGLAFSDLDASQTEAELPKYIGSSTPTRQLQTSPKYFSSEFIYLPREYLFERMRTSKEAQVVGWVDVLTDSGGLTRVTFVRDA